MLHFAWRRGRYTPPDRKLLEAEILPELARDPAVHRVLFVGVAWYTRSYESIFARANKKFVTLDHDASRADAGSSMQHVIGELVDLTRLVPPEDAFDAIVVNGVIGYGLDDPAAVDAALIACRDRLVKGGTLILGVNEERPTNVDPYSVGAHMLYEKRAFGRWDKGQVMVPVPFRERTHTFIFWRAR